MPAAHRQTAAALPQRRRDREAAHTIGRLCLSSRMRYGMLGGVPAATACPLFGGHTRAVQGPGVPCTVCIVMALCPGSCVAPGASPRTGGYPGGSQDGATSAPGSLAAFTARTARFCLQHLDLQMFDNVTQCSHARLWAAVMCIGVGTAHTFCSSRNACGSAFIPEVYS